ncbi:MAG: ADP-ribosylation factor-like protein [Candidatus Helarchaeota archaeon]
MLREIIILKGKYQIFKRTYGEGISIQALSPILVSLIDFLKDAKDNSLEFMNIINFKIAYATEIDHNLLFIFITDLTDDNENIGQQLEIIRDEFFSRYESIIDLNQDPSAFESFNDVADEVFKELRPKIALVGFSGVGKTTITRLIRAEDIPMRHVPTITGDVATIKLGHINLYLWDFAGQEKYSFVWNKFIKGADSVILILDSTPKNVRESKFFIELIRKEEPHARIAIVANKQDLPDAMSAEEIENYLNYKTYPMIAIDPDNRETMLNIIADTVRVRSLIQPFIKPLLERDKLISEAEAAIMAGNIQLAAEKFELIAQLCLQLEEEDLMQHFSAQAQFLRGKLAELQRGALLPEKPQIAPETVESTEPTTTSVSKSGDEKVVKRDKAEMEKILKEETEKIKIEKERMKKETEERMRQEEVERIRKKEEKIKKLEQKKAEEEKKKKEMEKKEAERLKKEEEKKKKEAERLKKEEEEKKKKEAERLKKEEEEKKKKEIKEKIEKPPAPIPIQKHVKPAEMPPEVQQLNKEKDNIKFKITLLAKQYKSGELSEKIFKNVLNKLENQQKEIDAKIEKILNG